MERTRKSNKRGQLWFFLPIFSKPRAFGMLHPRKWYVVLKILTENKEFYFSKCALRADTARNKWLKKALLFIINFKPAETHL